MLKEKKVLLASIILALLWAQHLFAYNYTPPLRYVQAWKEGNTIYYKVYDPEEGCWKEDSLFLDSNWTIARLQTYDGIVAWTASCRHDVTDDHEVRVYFAVYDPARSSWERGYVQHLEELHDLDWHISNLQIEDGIVAWVAEEWKSLYNDYSSAYVYFVVYDPTEACWREDFVLEYDHFGHPWDIRYLQIEDGIVAWYAWYDSRDPYGTGTTKSNVGSAVYDSGWTTNYIEKSDISNCPWSVRGFQTKDGIVTWYFRRETHHGSYDFDVWVYYTARVSSLNWCSGNTYYSSFMHGNCSISNLRIEEGTVYWTARQGENVEDKMKGCHRDSYSGYWNNSPTQPLPDFAVWPTSGDQPLWVPWFRDLSFAGTSWLWDFGDGANSTEQNPTHKYTQSGNFTVSLTATNSAGSETHTETEYIVVNPSSQAVPGPTILLFPAAILLLGLGVSRLKGNSEAPKKYLSQR